MILLLGFTLLFLAGYLFVNMLLPGSKAEEKIALSFGLGIGTISLLMFLVSITGIPLNKPSVLSTELFVILALTVVNKFQRVHSFSRPKLSGVFKHAASYQYFLWALIIILVTLSLVYNHYYPVYITDGLTTWDTKGKAIAAEGKVDVEGFSLNLFHGREYPLLIPLAHAFVYILGGEHPKIIYSLFYVSLILAFYFSLGKFVRDRKAVLIFTTILASTPYIWWHSFLSIANLATGYFYFVGTVLLLQVISCRDNVSIGRRTLLLSSLFYGFAAWTRLEFSYYFLLPLAFVGWRVFKEKNGWEVLPFIMPFLAVASPWVIYRHFKWAEWSVAGQPGPIERVLNFSFRPDILWVTFEHTVLLQAFAAASCLLILLMLFQSRGESSKAVNFLFTSFLGGYFLMHILLHYIIASYGEEPFYEVSFLSLVGKLLGKPGAFISYSPVREFIPVFYPMALFFVSVRFSRSRSLRGSE